MENNPKPNISYRGGSQIGWVNTSWPLVKLSVSAELLTLSGLGKHEFTPSQVVSFENYGAIPIIASGIRINHNRPDYPAQIVFWCVGSRKSVLRKIAEIGFVPAGAPLARAPGFPVRWSVVAVLVILWNALFLLDRSVGGNQPGVLGPLALLAMLMIFIASTATRISPLVQRFVLRPGHQYAEILPFVQLLQLVTGGLSIGFGIFMLSNIPPGS